MPIFLIHGAWHAAWCWERVAKQLSTKGHLVFTPDLPGHGANIRPAHTITFNDYVVSLINLIQQQTEPVTLVGHSMAGLIISQIAEMIPDHIRELVYVSAYIPKDQESLLSIAEAGESRQVSPFLMIDQAKQEIQLKSSAELKNIFFNCCRDEDAEYAMGKIQTQPLKPFVEKVKLSDRYHRVAKRSFVCRYDKAIFLADQVKMSLCVTDDIVYLDADHSAYFSGERELVIAIG
jgi:pimeloyl-ACP methyl ester carboxylesterase